MTERAFIADAREAKGLHDGTVGCLVRMVDFDALQYDEPEDEWTFRKPPKLWRVTRRELCTAWSPFGVVGDRLHSVCEPTEPCGHRGCLSHVTHVCEGCGRGHAGIFLDVTDVRVVRARDITDAEAKATGSIPMGTWTPGCEKPEEDHIFELAVRFDVANGEDAWEANPWVWLATVAKAEAE